MKLALQLGLIPGNSVQDKQKWAADNGVEGIEISAWDYRPERVDQAKRDFENTPVPVVSICGNPSFDFLDPDPGKRRKSMDECKQYLALAGELGAVGQIVPPIFGGPRINDLSPLESAVSLEKRLLVELVKELGDAAQAANTLLMLEPLNRYEQHLLRRQADGSEICEKAGHPSVAIIADFFHMHIEETDTPQAIRDNAKYIKHVHLADNTRQEPGTGDIDYRAGCKALHDIGFTGYMAYECGISGDDKAASLKKSLDYMRDCIRRAQG